MRKRIKVKGRIVKDRRIRIERRREVRREAIELKERIRLVAMVIGELKFDKENTADSSQKLQEILKYLDTGIKTYAIQHSEAEKNKGESQ